MNTNIFNKHFRRFFGGQSNSVAQKIAEKKQVLTEAKIEYITFQDMASLDRLSVAQREYDAVIAPVHS